jgi:hypothetical protein
MKRFLLFIYEEYEERGGWGDFHSAHESAEAARTAADSVIASIPTHYLMNAHVVDLESGKCVLRLDRHRIGDTWRQWKYQWTSNNH